MSAHRSTWALVCRRRGTSCRSRHFRRERGHNAQVLHEHIQQLATAVALVYALEHGRHLARLDRLEDLDDGLQVCVLWVITRQQHKSPLVLSQPRPSPHGVCPRPALGSPFFPRSPLRPDVRGEGRDQAGSSGHCRTFARSLPLYTGISRQPLSAPSASPPRSSCLTCPASARTSASPISGRGGCRVEVSKLTDESSWSASMLMVRQASLSDADVCCWMMDMVARRAVMVLRGQRWARGRASRGAGFDRCCYARDTAGLSAVANCLSSVWVR